MPLADPYCRRGAGVWTYTVLTWCLQEIVLALARSLLLLLAVKLTSFAIVILEIDECAEDSALCSAPKTCENTYRDHRCNCPRGQNNIDLMCKGITEFYLNFPFPLTSDNFKKNILQKKTSSKLKIWACKTRQLLSGDISTLFQSHGQIMCSQDVIFNSMLCNS